MTQAEGRRRTPANVLLTLASLIIVVAGLKTAGPFLLPLLVSAFLATLTAPLVLWAKQRRISPGISIPVLVFLLLVLGLSLGGLLGTSVSAFIERLPQYQARIDDQLKLGAESLNRLGFTLSIEELRSTLQPGAVMRVVGQTLNELVGMLSNVLLVLLTVVFLLFEAVELPVKVRTALGDPAADLSRWSKTVREVNRYVLLKTYTSLATGVAVALLLMLLGVDFPLLWGLLAFLLNYVPNIGSVIAAVPPVLLALVQFGAGRALAALGCIVMVNMLVGNVIEPRVMGRSLGLSTLIVFLSLVFWGWLWGPIGMLLSVPLTMVVKILLEHTESWRWLAILMGNAPAAPQTQSSTPEADRDRG